MQKDQYTQKSNAELYANHWEHIIYSNSEHLLDDHGSPSLKLASLGSSNQLSSESWG